ncbi:GntR family transcriptional regulator [Labrys sp. 22185]|uniref:GntR family transcriptional regulator n=1 Tax=Labrys sp. 22185 TaxID=3453888 RepID=UPI003F839018
MESQDTSHSLEILTARGKAAQSGVRPRRPRVTTATLIYDDLREAILGMRLVPGTPLQEKALTQRFGVSKTPVREALIRLAEDGLVDIFPQSGTFVSRVPVAAIPEAVVIRQSLEDTAVRRLIEIATQADIATIDAILARQRLLADLGDKDAFHEADEAFHQAIAQIAGYPSIPRLLRQIKVQMDRARRLTLPVAGRMHQVIAEHSFIRDAIARRDVEVASRAMKAHLSAVVPDIDRLRVQYPDYFV